MADNQYVKSILLKFKSEGDDKVKKTAENISKALNPKETEKFLKSLENIQNKFGRTGKELSGEMKKVTDYFKELNSNHFIKAERNLDRMGRLLKTQIENLDKLKREGASADVIRQRETALGRTAKSFENLMGQTPVRPNIREYLQNQIPGMRAMRDMQGMMSPGGSRALAGLGYLGMGVGAAANLAGMYEDVKISTAQNRIAVAETVKQHTLDAFRGDMSRAALYANPDRAKEIKDFANQTTAARSWQMGLRGLGGLIMTGGGAAIGGLLTGGLGAAGGAMIGSQLGSMLGLGGANDAVNAGKFFFGGGKEAYKQTQAIPLAEQAAASKSMDMEYYKYLSEKAPMRYEYQRQLQLGDSTALDVRRRFRQAGVVDEGQMAGMMTSFRRFGTRMAPFLGAQTAEMARQMGMSTESATQLMQSVGMTNRGGVGEAKKDLEELFARAVKTGVTDSGLIEEYQKSASALMQRLGGQTGAGATGDLMSKFMTGASDARSLQTLPGAVQAYGAVMGGVSPLMQAKKSARLLRLAHKDMNVYSYLSQFSNEQLAGMSKDDPVIAEMIKQGKMRPEDIANFQKGQTMDTMRSALGRVKGLDLGKLQQGGQMSLGMQSLVATQMGMQNVKGKSASEIQQFLKANLSNMGDFSKMTFEGAAGAVVPFQATAGNLQSVQANIDKFTTGTAAGVQRAAQAQGESELDRRAYDNISKHMDEIFSVYKKQSEEAFKNVDRGVLAGPISGISDAADDIRQALEDAARKVKAGSSAFDQAGSQ